MRCTCGNEFTTRSTQPEIHVEICSACHPFYTGRQKLVDTGGRVERFQRRVAKGRRAARRASRARTAGDLRRGPRGQVDGRTPTASSPRATRPLGGQAVLEGVMMRGVRTWAVAVRKPPPRAARAGARSRRDRRQDVPARPGQAGGVYRLPLIRGVVALGGVARRSGCGRSASRPTRRCLARASRRSPAGAGPARSWSSRSFRDRAVLRRAGRGHQPDQASARLVGRVLAGRGRRAHRRSSSDTCSCSRGCGICGACSSTTAPSTR